MSTLAPSASALLCNKKLYSGKLGLRVSRYIRARTETKTASHNCLARDVLAWTVMLKCLKRLGKTTLANFERLNRRSFTAKPSSNLRRHHTYRRSPEGISKVGDQW